MEYVEIEGLCDEGCWGYCSYFNGHFGIPVLMTKFIGNIPFVRQTTEHHSFISATLPDPHTSPNRASEEPLNQLNNRASDQLNNQPTIQPLLKPINGQWNKLILARGVRYHPSRHFPTGTSP